MLKLALSSPPDVLIDKAVTTLSKIASSRYLWWRDLHRTTFLLRSEASQNLLHYLSPVMSSDLTLYIDQISGLADNYLHHCFDLLGSGWMVVRHGMSCPGVEGYHYDSGSTVEPDQYGRWLRGRVTPSSLPYSQFVWQMVDPEYVPIDWHIDFKSGYRWRETTWYKDIKYGHKPGIDIKVPWELARMQHLPQLAWAYALALEGLPGMKPAEVYAREFRNQILDFIATNPPRFGVNWVTTMDVAIRAANWLVAYDLLRGYGAEFDAAFETQLQLSIIEHGEHIVTNLEWARDWRSNHYLANIAGLMFVAAYLPACPRVNTWLVFALQELASEMLAQFSSDGSNFEASTSYHHLSAEMVVYSVALSLAMPSEKLDSLRAFSRDLYRLPRPLPEDASKLLLPWSDEHFQRIEKMAEFTMHITKPSGRVPQFGDNDSGRFLKLFPACCPMQVSEACSRYINLDNYIAPSGLETYWDEEVLDHHHLVAAINGLYDRADLAEFADTPETTIIRTLSGSVQPSYRHLEAVPSAEEVRVGTDWPEAVKQAHSHSQVIREVFLAESGRLRDGLHILAYPDFGLYLYRSDQLYLAIRCGAIGQAGHGGHAHNDQLSIELTIDGQDRIRDPGTYLYTPLPHRRQEYRSVKAHYAPRPTVGEPGDLGKGLFLLGDEARAQCLYFGPEGFLGVHNGYGSPVYRLITVGDTMITIEDTSTAELCALPVDYWPPNNGVAFSPKYGARLR